MGLSGEDGLFGALKEELRKAKEPLDCNALFDKPSIREHAQTPNRVSDYLGNLWRKGLVMRVPAPRGDNNRARWMYVWKAKAPAVKPTIQDAIALHADESVKRLLVKPSVQITEEGRNIVITMPHLSITIRHG